jgi:hypothetical protein
MKKTLGLALVVGALLMSAGCYSGPRRLSHAWDNWTQQKYSENAWMHAVLSDVIPVYPFVGFVAGFGDAFWNMYYFWGKDAWDNKGTVYINKNPEGAAKTVTGSGLGM